MGYILVGAAGAVGAILRYIIGIIFYSSNPIFPFATFIVNMLGSFLLARFTTNLFQKISVPLKWKTAINTGFIGSFTTFSTLSLETVQLFEKGYTATACIYICLSALGGLFMSRLGFRNYSRSH